MVARATPIGAQAATRLGWVDALRGAAIVLMLVDHTLAQVAPEHLFRYTASRFGLPLFMICAAAVWHGPMGRRRAAMLYGAVCVEAVVLPTLGMAQPGIVTLYALCMALVWALWRVAPSVIERPLPLAVLALLQATWWPIGWRGYEVGAVLAWWCLGRLASDHLRPMGGALPGWLRPVGRQPLAVYVAHLVALWAVFA